MFEFHKHRSPGVIVLVILLLGWLIRCARAQDASAPKQQDASAPKKPEEAPAKDAPAKGAAASAPAADPAVVSAGMTAFEQSCTKCHDAARSLDRSKDLAGWRATVRRMAAKRGADIPTSGFEPIAVYLASRNSAAAGGAGGGESRGGPRGGGQAGGAGAGARRGQAPHAVPPPPQ